MTSAASKVQLFHKKSFFSFALKPEYMKFSLERGQKVQLNLKKKANPPHTHKTTTLDHKNTNLLLI